MGRDQDQQGVYKPQKSMVVIMPDGEFVDGDTFQELVEGICAILNIDYEDAEEDTKWHIRSDLADSWTFAARLMGFTLQDDIDPTSEETLIDSAARSGWIELYHRKG